MGSIGVELQRLPSSKRSKPRQSQRTKQYFIAKAKAKKNQKPMQETKTKHSKNGSKNNKLKVKVKLTEEEKGKGSYPIISHNTFITVMGEVRWKRLVAYCKYKFKSKQIVAGYTGLGPVLYCDSPLGKEIGLMSDILPKADKYKLKKAKKKCNQNSFLK